MRPADDIKRLIDKAQVTSSSQVDRRILGDALADLEQRRVDRLARRPGVWRRVMRTRTAKLAAAAVIVAAILISIPHVNDNVVKAVEFEEITQAMQHVPWMHAIATGFEPRTGGRAEQWIGFESKIHASRLPNGTALFMSERDHQQLDYDPNSRTITGRYLESLPVDVTSPAALLTAMHKLLEQQGAQMDVKMGTYQGRRAQIQSIALSNAGGQGGSQSLILYIDPDAKLLYGAEAKALDATGKVVMAGTMTFDYPSAGPQSIYDLGVPRDARIGDNGPGANVQSLLDQYERARAEATTEYIAVLTLHEDRPGQGDDVVSMVEVDFKSGRKRRVESHSVFRRGETAQLWPQYRQQLGDSFESLLAWTRRHYDDAQTYLSLYLYDGQYYATVQRDGKGVWSKNKTYSLGGFDTNLTLSRQAWPPIDRAARIIEDDYVRRNHWICLEVLSQGLVTPNGSPSLPGRRLYYLDPARDHLCRRQVTEQRRDASWQKDQNWLAGVDPQKVPQDSTTVIDISDVAQAANGHWYPQTIVESRNAFTRDKKPFQETTTRKVYLQVSPKFPDGIFDIDKLPGQ